MRRNNVIKQLILKDVSFHKRVVLSYLLATFVLVSATYMGAQNPQIAGVALMTMMVPYGIHLLVASVIRENHEKTEQFILALPITAETYARAKMVSGFVLFAALWLPFTLVSLAAIYWGGILSNGWFSFTLVSFVKILALYSMTLAVALVSRSPGWTLMAVLAATPLFGAAIWLFEAIGGITDKLASQSIQWTSEISMVLLVEVALIWIASAVVRHCWRFRAEHI